MISLPKSSSFHPLLIAKIVSLALICYLLYYFTPSGITSALPNPFSKPATITVIGTGKTKAAPNTAQFAVTIASTGQTTNEAIQKAKTKVQELISQFKELGLTDENIKLSSFNAASTVAQNNLIYAAGATMVVSAPDILTAEDLVNIALASNAQLSVPLTYTVSDTDKTVYEQKAREAAIKDANQKAAGIAKAYHKTLGKMISYTETPLTQSTLTETSSASSNQIDITQTIQVTFKTK